MGDISHLRSPFRALRFRVLLRTLREQLRTYYVFMYSSPHNKIMLAFLNVSSPYNRVFRASIDESVPIDPL